MILSERSIQDLKSILKQINLKSYDETVIKDILPLWRSASKNNSSIWEIASFIAHPEERTKGRFQENIDTIYAKILHSNLNGIPNQKINPFEIKESVFNSLIIGGIKLHDKASFQNELNISKREAIQFFNKAYKKDRRIFKLTDLALLPKIDKIFKLISGVIQTGTEVIKQTELINEIGNNLGNLSSSNNLQFNKKNFIKDHSNDITICIMCLLHSRLFKLYDNSIGKCELTLMCNTPKKEWELCLNGVVEIKNNITFNWTVMKFKGDIELYIPELSTFDKSIGAFPLKHFSAIRNTDGQLIIGNADV